jgi:hypothetical protein
MSRQDYLQKWRNGDLGSGLSEAAPSYLMWNVAVWPGPLDVV